MASARLSWTLFLPGLLVAATGVGAGDLLTAGFAGSKLGLAVAWAAVAGAALKFGLNEGLARWQMATGTTLLEGWVRHLGRGVQWFFLAYLLLWSLMVGAALISACGVAGNGFVVLGEDASRSKVVWGAVHSLAGLGLVWRGGFRLFERLMAVAVGVMVATVLATALGLGLDGAGFWRGLVPELPAGGEARAWTAGVIGGVGGTLTLLCYGYWIREAGRTGAEGVRACRLDLGAGYVLTGLFGVAMIAIGSRVEVDGPKAGFALDLARGIESVLGPAGRWAFLVGFWAAVFSSLVGVWQGVPYLFADFLAVRSGRSGTGDLARTRAYRVYLVGLALVPMVLVSRPVERIQLAYAVLGAFFMPFLAGTLLVLGNRKSLVGEEHRNGWLANLVLAGAVAFFLWVGIQEVRDMLRQA